MVSTDIDATIAASPSSFAASARAERILFWACVLAAGSLMWLAPRPPAIDLPQHAGQIALWRDLLRGDSPWSHLVFVNLLTPYLIGYGLALPLSFVLSVEASIALVLTLSFYAFVGSCVALRKELGSDERIDWLFLPSFFGFNWHWGFYTFLTAAPVLLVFLLFALRYRRAPTARGGAVLVALGAVLLFSHGLLFLFGLFAAGLLLLGPLREPLVERATRLAPLLVLTLVLAVFALATHERGTAVEFKSVLFGTPIWLRPISALTFITSDNWDPDPVFAMLCALALATPFFIGCRLNRGAPVILFSALAATFFLVPAYAMQTGYLFARFALFIPPFYAFLFSRGSEAQDGGARAARICMATACLAILSAQAWRVRAFAAESASFGKIERAAAPGHRALGLIFDRASPAARAKDAYTHFAAWYQADRGGFVDFNFAQLHPQVVRFRPGQVPPVGVTFVARPQDLNWRKDQAWVYDYFFVRGKADALNWLQARSPCRLSLAAADGAWSLVHRDSCPATPATTH